MTHDELEMIRLAIDDSEAPYTHSDSEIGSIFDLMNGAVYRVIAHFLLSDAISLDDPVAPTAPTLDEAPTFIDGKALTIWQRKRSDDLQKYSDELSVYRAQVDLMNSKREVLRNLAQMYLSMQGGY